MLRSNASIWRVHRLPLGVIERNSKSSAYQLSDAQRSFKKYEHAMQRSCLARMSNLCRLNTHANQMFEVLLQTVHEVKVTEDANIIENYHGPENVSLCNAEPSAVRGSETQALFNEE